MAPENHVFISYSHADAAWLTRLRVHLKPLERDGMISLWDDTRIKAGTRWQKEVEEALARARVAVLLISADFLASEFITANELPPLLAAAEENGTLILSVIVSPCRFEKIPSLSRFQAVNSPSEPLVRLRRAKREMVFVALSGIIEEAFSSRETIAADSSPPTEDAAPTHERGATFECPDCGHSESPLLHTYLSSCAGAVVWREGEFWCEECGMRIRLFRCDACGATAGRYAAHVRDDG